MSVRVVDAQEEDEADYKRRFPDHHAAFADIVADEAAGDTLMQDARADMTPHQNGEAPAEQHQEQQAATRAEAGSRAAQELLQGDLLGEVVREHARCVRA